MRKTIILHFIFLMVLGGVSFAADSNLNTENYGKEKPKGFSYESKFNKELNAFSLRSGRQFRGENVIDQQPKNYINLNTSIVYQKGQNSYVLPYKKKVAISRVTLTFNPNENLRKYD